MKKKSYTIYSSQKELDPQKYQKFPWMSALYCLYKDYREAYLALKEASPQASDESIRQAAFQHILTCSPALSIKRMT